MLLLLGLLLALLFFRKWVIDDLAPEDINIIGIKVFALLMGMKKGYGRLVAGRLAMGVIKGWLQGILFICGHFLILKKIIYFYFFNIGINIRIMEYFSLPIKDTPSLGTRTGGVHYKYSTFKKRNFFAAIRYTVHGG